MEKKIDWIWIAKEMGYDQDWIERNIIKEFLLVEIGKINITISNVERLSTLPEYLDNILIGELTKRVKFLTSLLKTVTNADEDRNKN